MGNKNLVGEVYCGGVGIFQVGGGGEWANFGLLGELPPVGKILDSKHVQMYRWISMFTLVGEGVENQMGGSYKCEGD